MKMSLFTCQHKALSWGISGHPVFAGDVGLIPILSKILRRKWKPLQPGLIHLGLCHGVGFWLQQAAATLYVLLGLLYGSISLGKTGLRLLEPAVPEAHRIEGSVACGTFPARIEPMSPATEGFLSTLPPGVSLQYSLFQKSMVARASGKQSPWGHKEPKEPEIWDTQETKQQQQQRI